MKLKRTTLIDVGIFVAVGFSVALLAIFFIGREKSLFEKRYTLLTRFDNISGLRMGAVVQLAGLNVGYVDGVRFPKEQGSEKLEVILQVGKSYKERIRKDSRASIETQGLLGDKYILITTGNANMPVLEDGEFLLTEEGSSLGALADSGKKTMQEIQEAAKKFRQTLDKLSLEDQEKGSIKSILKNIDGASNDLAFILSKVRKGEGTVGALLTDPALYHDLRALMGHANRNQLLKNMIRATIAEQEKATSKPLPKEK
ncbi:MAG: hypothetical protein A2W61_08375 [Deltaproteobacteria bacterium RIFCSPLOWO2_01_44_7]|nr:MAG: hypothetical protein A2712_03510 [Deltaproteobacteria bacterium RIFCSPHIGHO2_01_FULL_43_49]OGQ16259.1 MAG: hypothetical protein A3D22_01480 [Deltaproteobacteria bacterium RIFCSPHIGHO2_02_FULL_44_53]OGQ29219.1 MAG: hypothetical protein A3D98_05265 [Deltaproteobacteria bacterium RIFCSPHIGHO2_12_FULL_44_21]OGQ32776.1 MAG: hypothetical protein A2979_09410 [Deltaproteobacteria bacterium RIFCSPLOWO2_01_FULL_45_74]OGQ41878.1 MAG: hypothetical protein A3I70_09195 [Deltaproteobacteria bacterium 